MYSTGVMKTIMQTLHRRRALNSRPDGLWSLWCVFVCTYNLCRYVCLYVYRFFTFTICAGMCTLYLFMCVCVCVFVCVCVCVCFRSYMGTVRVWSWMGV